MSGNIFNPPARGAGTSVVRRPFGAMPDGSAIEEVVLSGATGVRAHVMTLGATLRAFETPDRDGRIADVTIGYDDAAGYLAAPEFWGQTVGRYANRIAGGRFVLDGVRHDLDVNDGTNTLHGGGSGFDARNWQIGTIGPASVRLDLVSPDGDQGFPGTMAVSVTYALDDAGALSIEFEATCDAPTVVNLTNHAVFNLSGVPGGTVDHRLVIPAARYLPVDAARVPTGEFRAVDGTVFDFTRGRFLSDGIRDGRDPQIVLGRGWDHNFVLDKGTTAEPALAARLEHPGSGRVLEVLTTEPGIQLYTGNFIDGTRCGKGGAVYRMGDGVALEPQRFPDAPNRPEFGAARLDPGDTYRHRMIYRPLIVDGA